MSPRERLDKRIHDFVLQGFTPRYGKVEETFASHPTWKRFHALGTELWLDTGSIDEARALWSREFSALTTNNTLLNREVQRGQYDTLIRETAALLSEYNLSEQERMLEIAFVLNARHGLKLVEQFDGFVSVEEHTAMAHDAELAATYARRFHRICPPRFIVKLPLTPAGLLATRTLAEEGVPVNLTLGFSARQNYVAARAAAPRYVNVFLGRLNSVIADNKLGTGAGAGEKATLASQAAIRRLRHDAGIKTRQIGASLRNGAQVNALAGVDVLTIPPKAAQDFLGLNVANDAVRDHTGDHVQPALNAGVDPERIRLNTLWDISPALHACLDDLASENLLTFSPDDLVDFFSRRGCGDLFVRWTPEQVAASAREGKIPDLSRWREALESKAIGLDSLMNLAGFNSFVADQAEMDQRVSAVLSKP